MKFGSIRGWATALGMVVVWTAVLAGWTVVANALMLALTPLVAEIVGSAVAYWVLVAVGIAVIITAYAVHVRWFRAAPIVVNAPHARDARYVSGSPGEPKL